MDGLGGTTVKHQEAMLWGSVEEASGVLVRAGVDQALFLKNGGHAWHPLQWSDEQITVYTTARWIEAIEDEAEFRSREDTW
jgi:hypothetical protein